MTDYESRFLGTGIMGAPMARNLLKAGFWHRRISTEDDHCSYRPIRELVNVGVRSGCI
jgi:3-hydroxyisobutyrate dehydrogenase-like beta-hydroxyacid dehydrogenase